MVRFLVILSLAILVAAPICAGADEVTVDRPSDGSARITTDYFTADWRADAHVVLKWRKSGAAFVELRRPVGRELGGCDGDSEPVPGQAWRACQDHKAQGLHRCPGSPIGVSSAAPGTPMRPARFDSAIREGV